MKDNPKNIDQYLPFGELLRGFTNQSYLSKGDLNKFLKSRGIFVGDTEKEGTVPCLATLLIAPSEFDHLRTCLETREDSPKKSTSSISVNQSTNIVNMMSDIDFTELIGSSNHKNYHLEGQPKIILDSKNDTVRVQYVITREDLNKSWYESSNTFTGELEFSKSEKSDLLIMRSYTSNESSEVGEQIQKAAIKQLKSRSLIKEDEKLRRVLHRDFSNAERFNFFFSLSKRLRDINFEFIDITDVSLTPDSELTLPSELTWMEDKTSLLFKGKAIQDTFFLEDSEYHNFINIWEIEVEYKFSYLNYSGRCTVILGFKDFITKGGEAELEIKLPKLILNESYSVRDRNKISNILLNLFNKKKEKSYHDFLDMKEILG